MLNGSLIISSRLSIIFQQLILFSLLNNHNKYIKKPLHFFQALESSYINIFSKRAANSNYIKAENGGRFVTSASQIALHLRRQHMENPRNPHLLPQMKAKELIFLIPDKNLYRKKTQVNISLKKIELLNRVLYPNPIIQ